MEFLFRKNLNLNRFDDYFIVLYYFLFHAGRRRGHLKKRARPIEWKRVEPAGAKKRRKTTNKKI